MQLLKSSKDFQLNKTTLVNLRLIAHLGQLLAIIIVKFYFDFEFSQYLNCLIIVGIGIGTNIFLHFQTKDNQLDNLQSTIYLTYDIIQLGVLLYLTGGVTNPFIIIIIVPSVFSSKYLNLRTSIFLASLTLFILLIISFYYLELPYLQEHNFYIPAYIFLAFLWQ